MTTPERIGRYEILQELGRGGMGVVYKARDPSMDRIVAVKTIAGVGLAGAEAGEYRERFEREARAAGRFAHAGIVTIHDVGVHEGTPFIVMEFVAGRSLADALATGERFPVERILDIGKELAEALACAHAHGVVHRDIKPANILLAASGGASRSSGQERAKIADFGVAKLAADGVTATGQLLGTPSFMSPEQFTGSPVDSRTDLFSLGVVLYWMATGEKPFAGDSANAVSYRIVHEAVVPPRRLNPAIPVELERIILKLIEKDPARRYQSGEAAAADLDAIRHARAPAADALETRLDDRGHVVAHTRELAGAGAPASASTNVAQVTGSTQPVDRSRRLDVWQTALLAVLAVAVIALVVLQFQRLSSEDPPAQDRAQSSEAPAPVAGGAAALAQPVSPVSPQPLRSMQPKPEPNPVGGDAAASRSGPNADAAAASAVAESAAAAPAEPVGPGSPPALTGRAEDVRRSITAALLRGGAPGRPQLTENQRQMVMRSLAQPVPADQSRLFVVVTGLPVVAPYVVEMDGQPLRSYQPGPAARGRRGAAAVNQMVTIDSISPGSHQFRVVLRNAQRLLLASDSVGGTFEGGDQRVLVAHFEGDARRLLGQAPSGAQSPRLSLTLD
jgi:serine/threonine-protein kinase